jgi:hypothetical protein
VSEMGPSVLYRLLNTEVEDAGTAGLRIVSWSGLVAKRSDIQMYGGSWLLDALEGRRDGCNYSIVVLHQRSRAAIGIRHNKAKNIKVFVTCPRNNR